MGIFNSKQTAQEILEKMDNCVDSQIHVGSVFLSCQLQKKLLEDQNIYNNKQLFWSRSLAIITAILTLATIALVFVTK
ncbi:MAG: hypothetical protein KBC69_00875 [Candidatus Magasanikbacteria bacterium]|nr:hypothetical protein [Candidatus Magasanikbacteria bacterium]